MDTIAAKKRDFAVKAKKLRREGLVTGSISGKELKESLSLTFEAKDIARLFTKNHVGSQVKISVEGDADYAVIVKSIDFDGLKHQFIDVTFQQLVADERIKASAVIELANAEKAKGFITRGIEEVEYEAYPADLVDKIIVDVSAYEVGTNLTVADLELAKNPKVHVLSQADSTVLHIAAHQKRQQLMQQQMLRRQPQVQQVLTPQRTLTHRQSNLIFYLRRYTPKGVRRLFVCRISAAADG